MLVSLLGNKRGTSEVQEAERPWLRTLSGVVPVILRNIAMKAEALL